MATKGHPKVPLHGPDTPARADAQTDVETTRSMNVNADVEHTDNDANPAIDSVETSGQPPYRSSVENDGEGDAGDIERGPA